MYVYIRYGLVVVHFPSLSSVVLLFAGRNPKGETVQSTLNLKGREGPPKSTHSMDLLRGVCTHISSREFTMFWQIALSPFVSVGL